MSLETEFAAISLQTSNSSQTTKEWMTKIKRLFGEEESSDDANFSPKSKAIKQSNAGESTPKQKISAPDLPPIKGITLSVYERLKLHDQTEEEAYQRNLQLQEKVKKEQQDIWILERSQALGIERDTLKALLAEWETKNSEIAQSVHGLVKKPSLLLKQSGSGWTLKALVPFLEDSEVEICDIKTFYPAAITQKISNQLLNKIRERFVDSLACISKTQSDSPFSLKSVLGISNEYSSRVFIDDILLPFCRDQRLTLNIEERFDGQLPLNIIDYVILDGIKRVGLVEAKSGKSLKSDNVAQLFLQLLSISEKDSSANLLGILTDGYRFFICQKTQSHFRVANQMLRIDNQENLQTLLILLQGLKESEK